MNETVSKILSQLHAISQETEAKALEAAKAYYFHFNTLSELQDFVDREYTSPKSPPYWKRRISRFQFSEVEYMLEHIYFPDFNIAANPGCFIIEHGPDCGWIVREPKIDNVSVSFIYRGRRRWLRIAKIEEQELFCFFYSDTRDPIG